MTSHFRIYLFFFSLITIFNMHAGIAQSISISTSQNTALEFINAQGNRAAQMLVEIGGIISPSGEELERAEKVAEYMKEIGLTDVKVEDMPNAIGIIPGKSDKVLVFISTLDDLETVALHQRESGKLPSIEGERVVGPGTNTSSITVSMLLAAEAIVKSGKQPSHTLVFAAVAQEETGLKGMHAVYDTYKNNSIGFVDILGDGRNISYGAMGIHWYKVRAFGPAGHTLRGGLPNVNQAMAKTIDRIFRMDYKEDRTVVNVSIIESGKVFNHKPEEAWFSLDMRSLNNNTLAEMESRVKKILSDVMEETRIEMKLEPYQITPGGQIPNALETPLVSRAKAVSEFLGFTPNMSNAGSSNMNIAIAGGTSAIGLGGERGGQRGFPDEWASIPNMLTAAKHVYLLGSFDW
ncbi:M20 family metallopeptidase [Indibacter alkaliphilus]|uniref:M20 family metallopeptidase n=1 Tax=Indibacter alkaliphilus TaxID=579922 RepID=UPI0002823805|nr:M20/M25/M40 family metallo-hydrolase [Indibacter alkaliphilus]